MKRFLLLLSCWAALASAADLATAHTVYVLSMSRGLDQYLANRLTNDHVFKVVTDPKLADVIFTDHLGEVFQTQLEKISPSPVPDVEEKDEDKDDTPTSGTTMFTPPVNKLDSPGGASTFGRSKGTLFLVDAKSREVLWSVYDPPKASNGKELDRTASNIVNRLKKDLGLGKKQE
jgi:hypothetical protein